MGSTALTKCAMWHQDVVVCGAWCHDFVCGEGENRAIGGLKLKLDLLDKKNWCTLEINSVRSIFLDSETGFILIT